MIFLEKVTRVGENFIECLVNFRSPLLKTMFGDQLPTGQIPSWVGLELMAQAVSAYAGYWALHANRTAVLGFLLGTRHYKCLHHFLKAQYSYTVNAQMLSLENGLASFESHIQAQETGELVADADLRVYSPDNVDDFLKPRIS